MEPLGLPWIVSWRPGGMEAALAWVFADEFNMYWWGLTSESRDRNPYALDMMTNVILYSLNRPLIDDIHARREARHRISVYRTEKTLVISMLEWADMFGANTFGLSRELTDLDSRMAKSLDHYLDQEYAECTSMMEEVSLGLKAISTDAARLKDQALYWVYLSEWLAVSSAATIAGVTVWTLMIRRGMYKTIKTTRLTPDY
jgi:hypothetical protein